MNHSIATFPNLCLEERINFVCNNATFLAFREYYNRFINLYVLDDVFFEVFMTVERDGIEKVEILNDQKKFDLYILYMREYYGRNTNGLEAEKKMVVLTRLTIFAVLHVRYRLTLCVWGLTFEN